MPGLFRDLTEAGQVLAPQLREFARQSDAIVLALPPGGAAVGAAVAQKLGIGFDLLLVRKLVVDEHGPALGALASGGVEVWDTSAIVDAGLAREQIDALVRRERAELERLECAYGETRRFPNLASKVVILVDDGIATGNTMRAALRAVQTGRPRSIIVAVPVASSAAVRMLRGEGAAAVVAVLTEERVTAIPPYYRVFAPPSPEEIKTLLQSRPLGDSARNDFAA